MSFRWLAGLRHARNEIRSVLGDQWDASSVEVTCSRFGTSRIDTIDAASFRERCPPLFPFPTEIPSTADGEASCLDVSALVEGKSVPIYFEVTKGDGRYRACDAQSRLYLSRQRMLYAAYAELFGGSLAGRTVLDVACSCGYFSFFCSRLGASKVLSLDKRREHAEQFELFRRMLDLPLSCEYRELDVEFELSSVDGPFDLVLASGILYHVYDHPRFLKELYDLAKYAVIIDTYCSGRTDRLCWPGLEETDDPRMSIHGPVLKPSLSWVLELLHWVGFQRLIYVNFPPDLPDHAGYNELKRAMVLAVKEEP